MAENVLDPENDVLRRKDMNRWADGSGGWWGLGGPRLKLPAGLKFDPCRVESPPLTRYDAGTRLRCGRPKGHTGRHAACGGDSILGVWT